MFKKIINLKNLILIEKNYTEIIVSKLFKLYICFLMITKFKFFENDKKNF